VGFSAAESRGDLANRPYTAQSNIAKTFAQANRRGVDGMRKRFEDCSCLVMPALPEESIMKRKINIVLEVFHKFFV